AEPGAYTFIIDWSPLVISNGASRYGHGATTAAGSVQSAAASPPIRDRGQSSSDPTSSNVPNVLRPAQIGQLTAL
ncbi:MAG: hypothetical protein ACUVWX_11325, partial [Kiritimatiellia bacterium]